VPVTSKSASADKAITVIEVSQGEATFKLLGETPMIQEAVGEKARRELLLPSGRKNATERATTQKHMPYEEFLASTYQTDDGPTALSMPATAFKDALRTAALDLTGARRREAATTGCSASPVAMRIWRSLIASWPWAAAMCSWPRLATLSATTRKPRACWPGTRKRSRRAAHAV
jgi:hypothetical protein